MDIDLKNGVPPQTANIEHGAYTYPVSRCTKGRLAAPCTVYWRRLRLYWRGAWFSLPPLPAAFLSSLASLLRRFILVISW